MTTPAPPPAVPYSDPLLETSLALESYDNAILRAYFYFGSWENMALAVELRFADFLAPRSHPQILKQWCLDRRLPLHYACALVDAMKGEVSLFDFFPYLYRYADPKKENP